MKKIYWFIIFSCLFFHSMEAQQEGHYTQFIYYKLGINPAFAGSQEVPYLTALYRKQWMGLEGAPEMQALSFNTPLMKNRIGFGVNLSRQSIGINRRLTGDLVYAYRIQMEKGTLGIGVQASIRYFNNDYTDDRLRATDGLSPDGSIPVGNQSRVIPNFGTGLYFSNRRFYAGFSIPRLIRNNIDFNDLGGEVSKEINHYYLMAGYQFELSDLLSLQPQFLLKYAPDVPLDADINLLLSLAQRYAAGITYRWGGSDGALGESIDLILSARLTDRWLIGFSYDLTTSDLREYNDGSIEALVQFNMSRKQEEIINPRFF
ncbi:MAG: type IX secretion system membrane protein PorP/SprF [Bacteroidota bacterium]